MWQTEFNLITACLARLGQAVMFIEAEFRPEAESRPGSPGMTLCTGPEPGVAILQSVGRTGDFLLMSEDAPGPGREEAVRRAAGTISVGRYRLPDVDLELGPSGPGKSAIVLALLGFIDLDAGELTVNGADARGLPGAAQGAAGPESRTAVAVPGLAASEPAPRAPHVTDGQIISVPTDPGLGPWLDQLGDGLDAVLAPWDHPVSGGEMQRLGQARAMLTGRPVFLLDEPTSHLDPATADATLMAVLERTGQRALLWVTRRPAESAAFPDVVDLAVRRHAGARAAG